MKETIPAPCYPASGHARIVVAFVAVIAGFTTILDPIATAARLAVQPAVRIRIVAVGTSSITRLPAVYHLIATAARLAVRPAVRIWLVTVCRPLITLLLPRSLLVLKAIATDVEFTSRNTIFLGVVIVALVAFFDTLVHEAVAAGSFQATFYTGVRVVIVSIITFLQLVIDRIDELGIVVAVTASRRRAICIALVRVPSVITLL
jgi:hypothetical protein